MARKQSRVRLDDEPIAKKAYYSIGEVCEVTDLKPHVLRYWETQFDALHPNKNRAGNRVYKPKDIELVLLVKNLLYDKKFTIEGARKRLAEMRKGEGLERGREDVLEPEVLAGIRKDLTEVVDTLTL